MYVVSSPSFQLSTCLFRANQLVLFYHMYQSTYCTTTCTRVPGSSVVKSRTTPHLFSKYRHYTTSYLCTTYIHNSFQWYASKQSLRCHTFLLLFGLPRPAHFGLPEHTFEHESFYLTYTSTSLRPHAHSVRTGSHDCIQTIDPAISIHLSLFI